MVRSAVTRKLYQRLKAQAVQPQVAYDCTITILGTDARIDGTFPTSVVQGVTSYYSPGYQFTMQFRAKVWDGKIKLYRRPTRTFPAGLVPDVVAALREAGAKVTVDDQRQCPGNPCQKPQDVCLEGLSFDYPFDYQPRCVEAMLNAQRGIVAAATNCLSGETVVELNRAGRSYKIKLKELADRFNGKGRYAYRDSIQTKIRYRTSDGYIRLTTLKQVVSSGIKKTYQVEIGGFSIQATADHRFLTQGGWKRLCELVVGDLIYVDGGVQKGAPTATRRYRALGGMDFHPFRAIHRDKRPGRRSYYSVQTHRLMAESKINGMDFESYVSRVRAGVITGLRFIDPRKQAAHHKNGDVQDNSGNNIEVKDLHDHWAEHGQKTWRNVTSQTVLAPITNILEHGSEPTFDIYVEDETHNFIANGIVVHNSGKTVIAALMIKALRLPALFLVPSLDLLHQTRKVFMDRMILDRKEVGICGDGQWQPGKWITVATVDTLHSRMNTPAGKALLDSVDLIFCDECFPRGTMVGDKPIETVRVGDMVPSFDESTQTLVQKRVTRVFMRAPHKLVTVFVGSRMITCTPGHPFYTQRGWLRAIALRNSDMVLCSMQEHGGGHAIPDVQPMHHNGQQNQDQKQNSVLRRVSEQQEGVSKEISDHALHSVPEASGAFWTGRVTSGPEGEGVLLRRVQAGVEVQSIFRCDERDQHSPFQVDLKAHEAAQPNEGSSSAGACEHHPQSHGLETTRAGRERQGSYNHGDHIRTGSGMVLGSDSTHRVSEEGTANSLQDRCSERAVESRCGDRRGFPLLPGTSEARSQEGEVLAWQRVDGVEVHEPTSDRTFDDLCPDGLVYNIEVEDTHTYLADGVVVHNCHHVAADTWYELVRRCNAFYRFGLSGTPLKRSDGGDMKLIGATGGVVFQIRNKELIERGISVRPHITWIKVTQPLLAKGIKYPEAYRLGIVENVWRNTVVARATAERVERGLNVLILVTELKHGRILDEKLWNFTPGSFIPHQFLSGQEASEVRTKAFDDFRRGDLRVLIATSIMNEGIDMPNIDALVLAAGGKSSIRTLQRVGRGLRKGGNIDRLEVVDFVDFQSKYLLEHSLQRFHDYRGESCFIVDQIK